MVVTGLANTSIYNTIRKYNNSSIGSGILAFFDSNTTEAELLNIMEDSTGYLDFIQRSAVSMSIVETTTSVGDAKSAFVKLSNAKTPMYTGTIDNKLISTFTARVWDNPLGNTQVYEDYVSYTPIQTTQNTRVNTGSEESTPWTEALIGALNNTPSPTLAVNTKYLDLHMGTLYGDAKDLNTIFYFRYASGNHMTSYAYSVLYKEEVKVDSLVIQSDFTVSNAYAYADSVYASVWYMLDGVWTLAIRAPLTFTTKTIIEFPEVVGSEFRIAFEGKSRYASSSAYCRCSFRAFCLGYTNVAKDIERTDHTLDKVLYLPFSDLSTTKNNDKIAPPTVPMLLCTAGTDGDIFLSKNTWTTGERINIRPSILTFKVESNED